MIPPFTAIDGFSATAFYRGPAGAFPGRTAAEGGFTASAFVWPQGRPGETHTYFANTDGATYGWWIERTAANAFVIEIITAPAGVVFAAVSAGAGAVGKPALIQLTLAADNTLYIIVNGTVFSSTALAGNTYVPAPADAVPTLGVRGIAGVNPMGGYLGGAAYVEPAEDLAFAGTRWAAATVARDMVDQPTVYGAVGTPYTNLYSARRGNNGQGNLPAVPGLGFLSPSATWPDEHGLIPLTREGVDDLQVTTVLSS